MTAPDHVVEPLKTLLREWGHPYMALSEGDPCASYRTAPHRHPPVTILCSDITLSVATSFGRFCRPGGAGSGFSSFRPGPASPSGKLGLLDRLPHMHPGSEYDL